jgi:hypothetical protein
VQAPADIQVLQEQLDAISRDANALADGISGDLGAWRETPNSWSVAECFDHLAIGNGLYLAAMQDGASRARKQGRLRHGAARPGLIGRWFIRYYLEPPPRAAFSVKAPRRIVPRTNATLDDAFTRFSESHRQMQAYLEENAGLDLTGARFVNPFIPGIRFSLATGLYVIAAHDRRHLWQGWRVRKAAEQHAIASLVAARVNSFDGRAEENYPKQDRQN